MKEFRIGLLGAGWISQTYVAALEQVPEGRAVAVWSRTREHAERFAERHGLEPDEYDLYGRYKAKINLSTIERLSGRPDGKLVCVTAAQPSP